MFTLVKTDDEQIITVFAGGSPLVATSTHPNFDEIVQAALDNDLEGIDQLFDVSYMVAQRFETLSERVSVANGRVYFDGDEVNNALTKQIVRFLDEDIMDWVPLVNFFEKVQANPNEHSREQLFSWLDARDFTLTSTGDFIAYKGVTTDVEGNPLSISSGRAIVDGEAVNGRVPNPIKAVVQMPREQVAFNPSDGCSTGLHVGTYEYASSFAQGLLLEVHVNPRDVVSVPTDCDAQKMRVCRYRVANTILAPITAAYAGDDYCDYDECDF